VQNYSSGMIMLCP